jgi:flavodoxin/NAD-dependent dihydropyrimidine dehydrogenase PreA subunit
MKNLVIYHSISGNTKKIAEAIHTGMCRSGVPSEIKKIREVTSEDLKKYDLIGLGSAVMHQRELNNISSFINYTMNTVDGKHGFAFCTHGAFPGQYLARVVPAMEQRGLTMIGWNDWFASVYHPGCPKPYFTDGHPDTQDLKEAEDFGLKMVELSKKIYAGHKELIPKFPRGKEYDDLYDPGWKPSWEITSAFLRAKSQIRFKVSKDKCKYPKCTFCIDNCPMHSIDFAHGEPNFGLNCDTCWLCEQSCPNAAIEIDWKDYSDAHRPMIDALENSLDIFEKRGKFRRLVSADQVGWDKFVWQYKKPRFKIG